MTSDQIKFVSEHWLLWVALFALGGIVGAIIKSTVGVLTWSDKRAERVAERVLTSEPVKKAMTEIASNVYALASARDEAARSELKQMIEDLKERDKERAGAVTRVHQKIDDETRNRNDQLQALYSKIDALSTRMVDQLIDLSKRLPPAAP